MPRLEGLEKMVNQYSNLQPRYLHLPTFFDESPLGNLVSLHDDLAIMQFLVRRTNIALAYMMYCVGIFFLQND